jgi:hypothetical protein
MLRMNLAIHRVPVLAVARAAVVLAIGLLASACGEPVKTAARPQLLSIEAARVENVSALEKLSLDQLAGPTPARHIEFEACVGGSNTRLESRQNADRID